MEYVKIIEGMFQCTCIWNNTKDLGSERNERIGASGRSVATSSPPGQGVLELYDPYDVHRNTRKTGHTHQL